MVRVVSVFFFFLIINKGQATPINELQEINLSKAELAIVDKDYPLAFKLITKNLSHQNFHYNSYIFLSDYYIERGLWSKAIRVYYYLIKKLHTNEIFKRRYTSNLPPYIKRLPTPPKKAMEVYFKTAHLYYSLSSANIFDQNYSKVLLHQAYKFYQLCSYYKYNLPIVHYYLSLIETNKNDFQAAIKGFLKTKELTSKLDGPNNQEFIDMVNQSLADTLIKQGRIDAGGLFLQNLYLKQSTSKALKEYAKDYLDSLQSDYLSLTFSGTVNNNSNINELSNEALKEFDQEIYISKDATSIGKSFNMYYTSRRYKYYSMNFSFDFIQENYNKKELDFRDYRNLSIYTEAKYDNLVKSIAKVSYLYNTLYTRPTNDSNYKSYQDNHTISGEYIHSLKSGTIHYVLPFTINQNKDIERKQTHDIGLNIYYIPYIKYKYFSPTYSFRVDSIEEEEDASTRSLKSNLSFSNHFYIKGNISIFLSGDYTFNSNSDESIAYREGTLYSGLTYAFKSLRGLSSTASYSYTKKWITSALINTQKYSFALSYSF